MTCDLWHVNVAVCDCILKRTSHTAVLFAMYFPPVFPHKQSFFEVRTPQHIKGIRQSIVSHIKLCYSRNISLDSVMSRFAHSCRIDVDCEQSLSLLGPSIKTPVTRKWPRAWRKARDGTGTRRISLGLAMRAVSLFSSRATALVSRVSRLRRSTLARACTPLTKPREKERLLAV